MRGYVEWMENQEREGLGTEHEDWLDHHFDMADDLEDETDGDD